MKKLSILTILFLSIIRAQPGTEVPGNMSFQGFLTDSEGVAYADGEYNLTFRLIRQIDETTEQTIWEESHSANVTNGVFSVILGDVTPLPLNISPNVQLETQVGDEILSPRQSLTSVPFALKSSRSQQAYQSVLSDTAMIALNAPMADTSQFSYHSQHADHADSSIYSAHSQHAFHADTSMVTMQADHANFADSSGFSLSSQHSIHADTAGLAIGIVGGIDIQHVEHATYADTAEFVDLSQHSQNIRITKNDDTQITLFSTGDGSSSYLTLIAQENDGDQTELRVINEGNSNELHIYDATNQNTLMSVGIDGNVTATSFSGDGSGLTGITPEIIGYGEKFVEITINGIQDEETIINLNDLLNLESNWIKVEPIHILSWDEQEENFDIYLEINDYGQNVQTNGYSLIKYQASNTDYPYIMIHSDFTNTFYGYSSNNQLDMKIQTYGRNVSLIVLCKVTAYWNS